MNRQHLVALGSGLLFAIGLGLSGMGQTHKVIGFLDVFGAWDPALLFVMGGAIAVHMMPALRARRPNARPLFAEAFRMPMSSAIDARLLAGAALFGLGWGATGYCPGPALVSLVTLSSTTLSFVVAMLVGMLLHAFIFERRPARTVQDGQSHLSRT